MKIARTLVLLAALVLSGCASAPAGPASESGPSTVPTAPAGQAQQRETGLTPPLRPFGGDCTALLSEAEASELLGTPAVTNVALPSFAPEVSAELHAGLRCRWVSADGSFASSLSVVMLPADAVSYTAPSGCEPAGEEYSAPRCVIEAEVNGTRVSGSVWITSDTTAPASAAATAFLSIFTDRANAAVPAPVPLPAVGAWAHPVDCEAVVSAGDVSSVPGLGAASVGMRFPFGGHPYATPAETALEPGGAEFPYCWIDGESADITFVAMGGGRWLESTAMTGATPITVDGYESAYSSPGQEGLTNVDIFDGPNWLHFKIRYLSNAKVFADALFAGLDATAAS